MDSSFGSAATLLPGELRSGNDLPHGLDDDTLPEIPMPPACCYTISAKARDMRESVDVSQRISGSRRRNSISRSPPPAGQRDFSQSENLFASLGSDPGGRQQLGRSDSMLRIVSLVEWLTDRGLSAPSGDMASCPEKNRLGRGLGFGNSNGMLVQGTSVTRSQFGSSARSASADQRAVDELMHLADSDNLSLFDIAQDLQIWQLKLLPRPARRRLLNLMAKKRRPAAPPPPSGGYKAEEEDDEPAKAKYDPDAAFRGMQRGGAKANDSSFDDDQENAANKYSGYRGPPPVQKSQAELDAEAAAAAAAAAAAEAKAKAAAAAAAEAAAADAAAALAKDDEDAKRRAAEEQARNEAEDRKRKEAEESAKDAERKRKNERPNAKAAQATTEEPAEEEEEEKVEPEELIDPFKLFRVKSAPSGDDDMDLLPGFGKFGRGRRAGGDGDDGDDEGGQEKKKRRPHTTGGASRMGSLADEFRQAIKVSWKPYVDAGWGDPVETPLEITPRSDGDAGVDGLDGSASPVSVRPETAGDIDSTCSGAAVRTSVSESTWPIPDDSAAAVAVTFTTARDTETRGSDDARPQASLGQHDGEADIPDSLSPASPTVPSHSDADEVGSGSSEGDLEAMFQNVLRARRSDRYRSKLQSRSDAAISSHGGERRWERRTANCQKSLGSLHALGNFAQSASGPGVTVS